MAANQDWTDPGFLDDARSWIREQLERVDAQLAGQITQDHVQPWSTVLRVPTDRGHMFFKANHDALRHEAAIAVFLSARRADFVPPLVGVDATRGWMLMDDAGARLRELVEAERSVERWLDLLPIYGSLQVDVSDSVEALIELGTPDLRFEHLGQRYETLLDEIQGLDEVPQEVVTRARDAAARVHEMSEQLAAYGIPETIQHDDLNDGQVYFRDGRYLLLDWGDACISHPFFSLSVALEGQISWGVDDVENSVDTAPFRDAYLKPFAEASGSTLSELQAATSIALRLGWACRAANGHVYGEDPTPTVRRLLMFLDGHL